MGDRRTDDRRPDAARPAHGQADPLDAEPSAARAGDEGDSEEVQDRQEEAARGVDEVLQGEPHQPGGVVLAASRAVSGLHLPVLRPTDTVRPGQDVRRARLSVRPTPGREAPELPLAGPDRHHATRDPRLGAAPARHLRGQPDRVDVLHVRDHEQGPALPDDGVAAPLHHFHRALPRRSRPLLGDDEPVDGRPGCHHAAARAEDPGTLPFQRRSSKASPKPGSDDDEAGNGAKRPDTPPPTPAPAAAAVPQTPQVRRVKRKKRHARR